MYANSSHISNRIFRSQRFMILLILSSFIALLIITSISGHGAALQEQVSSASDKLAAFYSGTDRLPSGKSDVEMEKEAEKEEEELKQSAAAAAAAEKENGKSKKPESTKADDDDEDEDEDEDAKDSNEESPASAEKSPEEDTEKDTEKDTQKDTETDSEKDTEKTSEEVSENDSSVVEATINTVPQISNSGPVDLLEEGEDSGEDTEVKLQQDDDIAATPPKQFSPDEGTEPVVEAEENAPESLDTTIS
ncbi:hypothetical protein G9P44_000670 [Scheffersomyces stipitis]|nr:hypothetical protein G9P44_000670 [Scheffersomyces stipitis]